MAQAFNAIVKHITMFQSPSRKILTIRKVFAFNSFLIICVYLDLSLMFQKIMYHFYSFLSTSKKRVLTSRQIPLVVLVF